MLEGRASFTVTRKEILQNSIKIGDVNSKNGMMIIPDGTMVNVEYLYTPVVRDNNTSMFERSAYDCERLNAISAIIMLYGEKCLDSEFLTTMMNQMLEGKAQVESAYIKYLEKTYMQKTGGRAGVAVHKSEPIVLSTDPKQMQ